MFRLTIQTDNAAFHEDDGTPTFEARGAEVARILRAVADRAEAGSCEGRCIDANGNKVGEWEMTQ